MSASPFQMRLCRAVLAAVIFSPVVGPAAEPASFQDAVAEDISAGLSSAREYLAASPEAADADAAYLWIFRTCLEFQRESDAIESARAYLDRPDVSASGRQAALEVLLFGLVKQGESEAAVEAFLDADRMNRFRPVFDSLDLAGRLCSRLQLGGHVDSAKGVYEGIARQALFNADLKAYCERQLAKLALLGEPAPAIEAETVAGDAIQMADFEASCILVDFWATNCPPCLAALPRLKGIYNQFHPAGFEIVGVSFDETRGIVTQFSEAAETRWPQLMNEQTTGRISSEFHVEKIPSTFLIDGAGKVMAVDLVPDDLAAKVAEMTAGAKP